jgi:hypothetical protein
VCVALEIEPRALHMLGQCTTVWAKSPAQMSNNRNVSLTTLDVQDEGSGRSGVSGESLGHLVHDGHVWAVFSDGGRPVQPSGGAFYKGADLIQGASRFHPNIND